MIHIAEEPNPLGSPDLQGHTPLLIHGKLGALHSHRKSRQSPDHIDGFQTWTVPSRLAEAMDVPSEDQATPRTSWV
ncbi:hypothetical protein KSC_018520 [Ktedonobacter sp. SOSP1-52]|nr:hypothetical protein KSC_018520 [Ktedonobacter sp. SOSP1-52]